MHRGSVKWFNNAKGYGFIISDEFTEDLFIHYSAINVEGYKTLKAGQDVSFQVEPGNRGLHAIDITPLDSSKDPTDQETQQAQA
ncbi:cold shock domain-containing protein [Marinomonas sp.]